MKKTRVKLLRQLKEESERFRQMKRQKEKEVCQLQQQDRKHVAAMSKMKQQFNNMMAVLKRKREEANAANKRLNDVLEMQRSVGERRLKEKQNALSGSATRIQRWLNEEMEIIIRSKEAHFHVQNLIDDRKVIVEQINKLTQTLEKYKQSEKKSESEEGDENTDQIAEISDQIKILEEVLDLRNNQIKELQQKILDADQDEKNKHRWESINLLDAKIALKYLFEKCITCQMENFHQKVIHDQHLEEKNKETIGYKNQVQKLENDLDDLNQKLKDVEANNEINTAKLIQEYEDRVMYFMKLNVSAVTNTSSSNETCTEKENLLIKTINAQAVEIDRLRYLSTELAKRDEELKHLREQLVKTKKGKNPHLMSDNLNTTFLSSPPKKLKLTQNENSMMNIYLDDDDEEPSFSSNDENDPDWRLTPAWKRTKSRIQPSKDDSSGSEPSKRKLSSSCACQSNCKTLRCKCKKKKKTCDESCKCDPERCINSSTKMEATSSNSTFIIEETSTQSILKENNSEEKSFNDFIIKSRNGPNKKPKLSENESNLHETQKTSTFAKSLKQTMLPPIIY